MNNEFKISHTIDNVAKVSDYYLHNHNDMHEILLFIAGDSEFRVEGNMYKLKPFDLVIASNNELHRMIHLSSQKYERYVLSIKTDFFVKNNCLQFSDIFEDRKLGSNNLFDSELVLSSGIYNLINKIYKYSTENEELVSKCVLIELLYLLNKASSSSHSVAYNSKHIREIVAYINENLTGELSLELLSKHFHISTSHISREFKKHMKMPIKKYITYKRLILCRELFLSGMSLLEASFAAGFQNYSNFYRMYMKEYHHSPKEDLINKK